MHRPYGYDGPDSDITKTVNSQNWYVGNGQYRNQAPLIIDPTPSGKMESDIKSILQIAACTSDIRIQFYQRGGRKISSKPKSDPFADPKCDRNDCITCSVPKSRGGCRFGNVGYQLVCMPCSDQEITATYEGETAKSAYEHGQQHVSNLSKKVADTPMWKHAELHHQSDNSIEFSMQVTSRFKKPMVRQEDESIHIRESVSSIKMNSKSEFHQPPLIRLVAASGNVNLDQQGNPAVIMQRNSKCKAQAQPRSDSPVVMMRTRSKGLVSSNVTNPVKNVQHVRTISPGRTVSKHTITNSTVSNVVTTSMNNSRTAKCRARGSIVCTNSDNSTLQSEKGVSSVTNVERQKVSLVNTLDEITSVPSPVFKKNTTQKKQKNTKNTYKINKIYKIKMGVGLVI